MNDLSWLIYLADVADSFANVAIITSVIAPAYIVIGAMFSYDTDNEVPQAIKGIFGFLKTAILIFLLIPMLLVALPSKDTIYAIAASEFGEDILKSEIGNKAYNALDAWLDKQLEK